MSTHRTSLLAIALAALVAVSCGPTRPEPTSETNLIVITLDTTRADRLGCYGHTGAETPHLDSLAARGTRFANAFAHTPMTLPSHCSVFTGLYPTVHGVRDNGGFKLQDEIETLAEVLYDDGYRTAAFVAAKVLSGRFGLAQGFETYDEAMPPGKVERAAGPVIDSAVAWIEQQAGERFFVWIHLFDPHLFYRHPEPFKSRFTDPYDGEIAYMDSQIGRLLAALERAALFDDSAIVVVGDHGEGLGDHGEPSHGYFAYDATLRIPLIVKPGGDAPAPRVVRDPVRIVDLMPTALSLLGYTAPAGLDGSDLAPLVLGTADTIENASYGESYLPYYKYGFSPIRSLRTRKYKLLESPERELYDVESDPGETHNLIAELPEIAEDLAARLAQIGAAAPADPNATMALDKETLDMLSALGYVGGAHGDLPDQDEDLPSALEGARHHLALGRIKLALHTEDPDVVQLDLDQVLAEHPDLPAALELQAAIHFQQKAYAEAERVLLRVVEADPTNTTVLQKLALAQMAQGNGAAALAVQRQVVSLAPDDREARENLWKLYRRLGRDSDALEDIREVRRREPGAGYPWLWQGRFKMSGGDATEVERAFRQAARDPASAYEAYIGLGRLYRELQQPDRAKEALESAVALSSEPVEALVHLARVTYEAGEKAAAKDYLERARTLAPNDPSVVGPLERLDAELQSAPLYYGPSGDISP